jgi:hypothetical protein
MSHRGICHDKKTPFFREGRFAFPSSWSVLASSQYHRLAYAMQNDQEKSKGSAVFDFCGLRKRRKKENDTDPVDDGFLSYCGIKKRRSNNKIWRIDPNSDTSTLPNHLEAMLADYTLATTPTKIDAAPAPVGLVLQLLLADARQKVQRELAAQSIVATESKGPFWGYDQMISLEDIRGARGNVERSAVSYALWYGDLRYFEANCVVVQAKQPIADISEHSAEYMQVLGAMCE